MTRISKQGEVRRRSPRKRRNPSPKTGPKRDNLEFGYRPHHNAITADVVLNRFIPKMGS